MADVLIFPYLPLPHPIDVGPFRIIPKREIADALAVEPWILKAASGLLQLYALPDTDPDLARRFGCVVASKTEGIGGAIDRTHLPLLNRAVLTASLDENPRTRGGGGGGEEVLTSDNALLYVHPVDSEGRVTVEYGFMSRLLVAGLQIGSNHALIGVPPELRLPLFAPEPDGEYANAVYDLLGRRGDVRAQRLGLAIDWLDIAWRNTRSIDKDVRIVGLRAGFEALLGVRDDFKAERKKLSTLLEPHDAPAELHTYPNAKGDPVTERLTDVSWWFTSFCDLRNRIMHGTIVPSADYLFSGEHHVMLGERRLRDAIKHMVALAGHPEVLQTRLERVVMRAVGRAGASEIT